MTNPYQIPPIEYRVYSLWRDAKELSAEISKADSELSRAAESELLETIATIKRMIGDE